MKNLAIVAVCNAMSCELREEFNPDAVAAGVDNFSNPNKSIMDEIKKEEEDREREAKKNAAKIQMQKDSYDQESEVLANRRDRAAFNARNEATKARTKENELYLNGGVDTKTHQENLLKIEEDRNKAIDKAEKQYREAISNLREKNPDGWRRSTGRTW